MWENQVGRSRAFWEWCLPRLKEHFGEVAAHLEPDAVYAAVNVVEPGLIRVEADEATYNLHIMLRFEIEQAMLRVEVKPRDVPAAWNERMKREQLEAQGDLRYDIAWTTLGEYLDGMLLKSASGEIVQRTAASERRRIARKEPAKNKPLRPQLPEAGVGSQPCFGVARRHPWTLLSRVLTTQHGIAAKPGGWCSYHAARRWPHTALPRGSGACEAGRR
jgi:hypothetical protein